MPWFLLEFEFEGWRIEGSDTQAETERKPTASKDLGNEDRATRWFSVGMRY
jgi:hypothetical protein